MKFPLKISDSDVMTDKMQRNLVINGFRIIKEDHIENGTAIKSL